MTTGMQRRHGARRLAGDVYRGTILVGEYSVGDI